MNAQKLIIPAAARGAAAHSVAVLDPDGRVIISTLPSEITSGADLFKELLPADRRMFATGEGLNFDRYFFASENGEYILLTGLLETHGVVLAAARGCREISVSVKETDDRQSLKAELAVDLACSPPDAQAIEALFGGVFGLKCKNFHAEYIGSTLVFSLCPAVFDPDAEGLMQGGGILRAERRKNEASRRI